MKGAASKTENYDSNQCMPTKYHRRKIVPHPHPHHQSLVRSLDLDPQTAVARSSSLSPLRWCHWAPSRESKLAPQSMGNQITLLPTSLVGASGSSMERIMRQSYLSLPGRYHGGQVGSPHTHHVYSNREPLFRDVSGG